MELNSSQYAENLFEAIDVLIARRLRQMKFDTTIIATITDNSEYSALGQYTATIDNKYKFSVRSDNPNYEIGDKVVVLQSPDSSIRYIVGLWEKVPTKEEERARAMYELLKESKLTLLQRQALLDETTYQERIAALEAEIADLEKTRQSIFEDTRFREKEEES